MKLKDENNYRVHGEGLPFPVVAIERSADHVSRRNSGDLTKRKR
jgi:hypothetical protein